MSIIASGNWPQHRSAILDWLVNETATEPFVDNIFVQLCLRLRQEGVSVARATMHVRINHPQWLGARMLWRVGLTEADLHLNDYDTLSSTPFMLSPVKAILDGASEVRGRLHAMEPGDDPFPIYDELRSEGLTDYVMWPLQFTRGQRHTISFAADGAEGFSADDIALLADLLPAFNLVTEIRLRNRLARTFLETYVGPHASEQILAGATRRGSGVTVSAAIVIYDLRGFTSISEHWPRDDVIAMLNDYFDAISDPIEKHGGEILKFMGDGLLAIFPLDRPDACAEALRAVTDGQIGMAALNARRVAAGLDPLGYGVGLHLGDVMYGNIGSRARLDFTVIGPAVNVASRLETLTKSVGRPVLLSGDFVRRAGQDARFEPLGELALMGVAHPVEVFAFSDGRLASAA